jgi:hydrogenase-4 component F
VEIALVLGVPLLGGVLLALFGHKRWAPELNAAMSLATFCAAALLTARVIADGPMIALDEQFFVDPFNVFLVALTAFVAFTTALFSRPYMRIGGTTGASTRRACVCTTACNSWSPSPWCYACFRTTSASCGSRWRARRSPRCCW